jgi:hypothetical protein
MSLFWGQLVLLTLLSSILISKLLRRERARTRQFENKPDWTGTALDASSLNTRIKRLREDYALGIRANPSGSSRRDQVVESIRQTIKRLAYFHRSRTHSSVSDPHETLGSQA